jgi:hypothetical protein
MLFVIAFDIVINVLELLFWWYLILWFLMYLLSSWIWLYEQCRVLYALIVATIIIDIIIVIVTAIITVQITTKKQLFSSCFYKCNRHRLDIDSSVLCPLSIAHSESRILLFNCDLNSGSIYSHCNKSHVLVEYLCKYHFRANSQIARSKTR